MKTDDKLFHALVYIGCMSIMLGIITWAWHLI